MTNPTGFEIKDAQDNFQTLPPMDEEDGSSFGWIDRLFFGWRDGKVFDYTDWAARDMQEMMKRDYKSVQIEQVMALPILSADTSINPAKGDTGEAQWLINFWDSGFCETSLREIIATMTSAFIYKRAYYEKVWDVTPDGKVGYKKVAFRPQTTCRLIRDPANGNYLGFEQEPFYLGATVSQGMYPIEVPAKRAYVFTHGTRIDPMNGSSALDVAYWAYKTKVKVLFLWFQYLESVSLPRTVVMAQDQGVAVQIAKSIAGLKSSGVLPVAGNPSSVQIETLGQQHGASTAADQFQKAIDWLDQAATHSVLAGFLDLTRQGPGTSGSYALSSDASDFFLQADEARATEMEDSITRDLFGPLVKYNFGPNAAIPKFKFAPLNSEDKTPAINLLTSAIGIPGTPVPIEFISALAKMVADYLGMDSTNIEAQFSAAAKAAQALAAQSEAGATPGGQGTAALSGATTKAQDLIDQANGGPKQAVPGSAGIPTTVVPNRLKPSQSPVVKPRIVKPKSAAVMI